MKESDLIFGLLISFQKNEYSFSDILWLTAPFAISETTLRTNLSRMVGNNILCIRKEGKKAFYSFTSKSKKYSSNVAQSFKTPNWFKWENNWWGISISIPEKNKSLRYRFKKQLINHRFALLHPGFWIRPFNKNEKNEERLKNIIHHKHCKAIVFNFFQKKELKQIPLLWNIEGINKIYKECLNYIKKSYNDYNLENPKEALIGKMEIGDIVVKQLYKDPLLPEIFLPNNWQGNNLRNEFSKWIKLTTEKSKPYWGKIFEDKKSSTIITQTSYGKNLRLA